MTNNFHPNEQQSDAGWVDFKFKLLGFRNTAFGLLILGIVVSLLKSHLSYSHISFWAYMIGWFVAMAVILGFLFYAFKKNHRVRINLERNLIEVGDNTYQINQVNYVRLETSNSILGSQTTLVLGVGEDVSRLNLELPRQKIFSKEEYGVLREAAMRFTVPQDFQGAPEVQKRITKTIIGRNQLLEAINGVMV